MSATGRNALPPTELRIMGEAHRGAPMAKASELLRGQAERCAQLANLANDQSLARNLRAMAENNWARADPLEQWEQQQQIQPKKDDAI